MGSYEKITIKSFMPFLNDRLMYGLVKSNIIKANYMINSISNSDLNYENTNITISGEKLIEQEFKLNVNFKNNKLNTDNKLSKVVLNYNLIKLLTLLVKVLK